MGGVTIFFGLQYFGPFRLVLLFVTFTNATIPLYSLLYHMFKNLFSVVNSIYAFMLN
jgi:hypothetical protein